MALATNARPQTHCTESPVRLSSASHAAEQAGQSICTQSTAAISAKPPGAQRLTDENSLTQGTQIRTRVKRPTNPYGRGQLRPGCRVQVKRRIWEAEIRVDSISRSVVPSRPSTRANRRPEAVGVLRPPGTCCFRVFNAHADWIWIQVASVAHGLTRKRRYSCRAPSGSAALMRKGPCCCRRQTPLSRSVASPNSGSSRPMRSIRLRYRLQSFRFSLPAFR